MGIFHFHFQATSAQMIFFFFFFLFGWEKLFSRFSRENFYSVGMRFKQIDGDPWNIFCFLYLDGVESVPWILYNK